jgi:hypothetical protein
MSTSLKTSVDSLRIVGGVRQEKVNNVGIVEESPMIPTKQGRGNVYVLVEIIGGFPNAVEVEQQVIGIIKEYYRTPGSITASIRCAIKAANAYLFEENLNAPRDNRGIAGVTCVILKDRDAYVGQCGPAALYHIGQGQFERLPHQSSWLTSSTLQDVDVGKQPPLGLRREIEPLLAHLRLREDDLLILASSSLAKLVSDQQLASAARQRGADTLRDHLASLAEGEDFSVVILEIQGGEPESSEHRAAMASASGQPGLRSLAAPLARWSRTSTALRGWFRGTVSAEEEPGEAMPSTDAESRRPFGEEGQGSEVPLPPLDLGAGLRSLWQALSRVGQLLATLVRRVLPETESTRKARGTRSRAWDQSSEGATREAKARETALDRRWLYAAAAIPIVVLLLVLLSRMQYQRSKEAEFTRLITAVQEAKTAAESSTIVAEQRVKLEEMLSLIDQGLQAKPDHPDLLKERETATSWLDRVSGVSRIFYFGQLQEFASTEVAPIDLRRVVVQGIDVFVLDLGTDRVYKFLLNEAGDALKPLEGDQVLLRKGDQRGDFVVDELLDMAWVEAGGFRGASNLLTLDRKGHVLQYEPLLGLSEFPDADSSSWVEPTAASGYVGRLYLLDSKANQVFRFVLSNSGYEGAPTSYFDPETAVDVSQATDLAIDGHVFVLHSNGMISKYREGKGVPFPQNNLDVPLKSPRSLFVTGSMDDSGYVYVTDSGNQRIVQFSKAGEFLRQFRASDAMYMSDLRSVFVDEEQKRLFLLNGNKLYLAYLPE